LVVADDLAVWLYGIRVAVVDQERNRFRLAYTEDALAGFPLGTPLLSLSLPLTTERYTHGVVRPFLEGLLPEGEARRAAAQDFDLSANDTYGLIRALGRECAGAVVIQPAAEPAPQQPTTRTAEPVSDDEIAHLVANLRSAPLGVDERVRLSLAGVQEKLVLTRMPGGSWGRPVDGTPSTHILKPELADFPKTVENEAFCMRVARHLGLPVANVETTTIDGRRLLVVERFDRNVHPDGSVERVHQEDFCQATGRLPTMKYEDEGGPSLRQIAEILQSAAAADSVEVLLRSVTLNVVVGNGDAHGKNFSLLYERSGGLTLSPLYDVLSTLHYGLDKLAMYIDNVHRTNRVTADRLVAEATRWGLSKQRASEIVADVLERAPSAIEAAHNETGDLPDEIAVVARRQLTQLRSAFTMGNASA
jgi:serine/threonine-protein kinase HipA